MSNVSGKPRRIAARHPLTQAREADTDGEHPDTGKWCEPLFWSSENRRDCDERPESSEPKPDSHEQLDRPMHRESAYQNCFVLTLLKLSDKVGLEIVSDERGNSLQNNA